MGTESTLRKVAGRPPVLAAFRSVLRSAHLTQRVAHVACRTTNSNLAWGGCCRRGFSGFSGATAQQRDEWEEEQVFHGIVTVVPSG